MRRFTLAILAAALLMLLASACKQNQSNESAAVEEDQPAAGSDDQASTETEPAVPGRTIDAIDLPNDWVKVHARTPKGVTVSFGLPSEWLEIAPPNESTLLVRGAPDDTPAAGARASVVSMEFTGGRTELAEYARGRLVTFATIKSDAPLRIGTMDVHELVSNWSTATVSADTVQLLVATGQEGIGVTCGLPSGQLEVLGGLCDEIFATLSIEDAAPDKDAKP